MAVVCDFKMNCDVEMTFDVEIRVRIIQDFLEFLLDFLGFKCPKKMDRWRRHSAQGAMDASGQICQDDGKVGAFFSKPAKPTQSLGARWISDMGF